MSPKLAVPHSPRPLRFALAAALTLACAEAQGQAPDTGPLYDPAQLPVFHGTIQVFTLTPRGDIDGFLLAEGIEVKTPPHLTTDLAAAVKPGDRVTIHGLKAASLPLVQAMSVSNDASQALVVDTGPPSLRAPPPSPHRDDTSPVPTAGRLRMLLHGPRGDVNGAVLEDGTILKLSPPEAVRFATVLAVGREIALQGVRYTTLAGTFVALTALGPAGGPLQPVTGGPRSSLKPTASTPV